MQVRDSFSDKTTYGIIIKDDNSKTESNSFEFSSISKVYNSNFHIFLLNERNLDNNKELHISK